MLKRLFLLPQRAILLPLDILRPNLPSLPLRSRALRKSSLVDGLRSFVTAAATLSKCGSVRSAEPDPTVLCNDFFDDVSATFGFDGFLFKISEVDERLGDGEMSRYGDGLTERGTYSWYCNSGVVEVVGVTAGVTDADDDGYRCGDCG